MRIVRRTERRERRERRQRCTLLERMRDLVREYSIAFDVGRTLFGIKKDVRAERKCPRTSRASDVARPHVRVQAN
jgi:hypothetical protein